MTFDFKILINKYTRKSLKYRAQRCGQTAVQQVKQFSILRKNV